MANIIMNIDRTLKETNNQFLNLIQSLSRTKQSKIKKNFQKVKEAIENKSLKSINKLFDENIQLKNKLKEEKLKVKEEKKRLIDLKKEKNELLLKINEENEKRKNAIYKYLNKSKLKELKGIKEQLKEQIYKHPITKQQN